MNIYVCVKHVPDSAATITVKGETDIEEAITFLMNPYDEHAVTEAHRLKSIFPDAEVIAVSVAKTAGENTLRSALAMGADRGILVTTDKRLDPIMTARALKTAITQDGQPGIILTGKESIDAEGMQTMFRVRSSLQQGVMPTEDLLDAVLIFAAGIVLLTPGFITDISGLLLLIPETRLLFKRYLKKRLDTWMVEQNVRIDRFQ